MSHSYWACFVFVGSQPSVQSQYLRDFRRFGEPFATGDREFFRSLAVRAFIITHHAEVARDALKDIIIHLQGQVITNLKIAWQQDAFVDFHNLQDVSDLSQDRAVMALLQLQQRILTQAPINELTPARPSLLNHPHVDAHPLPSAQNPWTNQQAPPRISTISSIESEKKTSNPFRALLRRPKVQTEHQQPPRIVNHSTGFNPDYHFPANPYRDVQGDSLLREPSIRSISTGEEPIHGSRLSSASTESSTDVKPDNIEFNPWSGSREPSPTPNPRASQSSNLSEWHPSIPSSSSSYRESQSSSISEHTPSPGSAHRPSRSPNTYISSPSSAHRSSQSSNTSGHVPPMPTRQPNHTSVQSFNRLPRRVSTRTLDVSVSRTLSSKPHLPGQDNDFAGFCKGAWRLQIGDRKKALTEWSRPGSLYSMNDFWKCTKCNFEGPMTKDAKGKKAYDRRVLTMNGIHYRWEFLFKSHVHLKETMRNPDGSTFGCIFCCAEGRGTPIFGGTQSFTAHLREHLDRLPTGEVLYRINCIFDSSPKQGDEFDICLPPRVIEEI